MKIFSSIALVTFLLISESIYASGLDDLLRFYNEIRSYSASFEQKVVDENLKLLESSDGEFSIQRPGKFRWHYTNPSEQLIVGDGKEVWIYDVELEQITHRQSDAAVSQTPAMLLSGEGDLGAGMAVIGMLVGAGIAQTWDIAATTAGVGLYGK